MLSLFTLSLIPALAAGGLVARDNNTGSAVGNAAALANAAANLPKCAVSCTLKTAPLTKCNNPADLSCSCTDQGFQSQILACYQQSCNATELNNTLTIGAATCVAAGHPTAAPGGANMTAAANHTATSSPVTPATAPAANSSPTSDANTQVPTLCVALFTTVLYALVSTTLA